MACLIVGDSIAQGIHAYAPRCTMIAHRGWSSTRWHDRYHAVPLDADRVVISLGSNDWDGDTGSQIAAIRAQVQAGQVVWIVPACNDDAAKAVEAEAAKHGDALVRIKRLEPDRVHPTWREYAALARRAGVTGR